MAIDVRVVPDLSLPPSEDTAGWWMRRLSGKLIDPARQTRFKLLDDWYAGTPPLPPGARGAEEAYLEFQRYARSNFAALIAGAPADRMKPIGIRTSSDGDATGDAEAWRIWRRAGLPMTSLEVHRLFLRFGECPVITGPINPRTGVSTITAEDPRQTIVECDPVDGSEVAGLKLFCDDIAGEDLAYLYRPGRVDVAVRQRTGRAPAAKNGVSMPRFDPASWDLDPERSVPVPEGLMPAVLFRNIDGKGEFEAHLDLLSRINHMILQRLVIAVMQAFRQRFAEGGLPAKDEHGRPINWSDIFAPSAGAFWALPPGVSIKDLGQVDLTPVLSAVRDDLKHVSAVTKTPMSMLDPSGENQTAEGAALAREGLVFRTEDRIARATGHWDRVMHNAFLWAVQEAESRGDSAAAEEAARRADLNGIDVIWAPPDRSSLAEKAAAAAQAKVAGVPWETVMTDVMQYSPDQVDRMRTQRDDDLLFAQQLAQVKAAQNPQPAQAGTGGA